MSGPTPTPTPAPGSGWGGITTDTTGGGTGGGAGGNGDTPTESLVGQIVNYQGTWYAVQNVNVPMPSGGSQQFMAIIDASGTPQRLRGGNYVTQDGRLLQVNDDGTIIKKLNDMTQTQMNNLTTGGSSGSSGASGGGGGSATPYGFNAPDPKGAATLMMNQWIDQINASKGVFDMDAAVSQFKQDYNKYLADTQYREEDLLTTQNRAENEDRRLREAQQAANRIAVAGEATTRGRSLLTDYLPNVIPGAQAMNFGGLRIPMMQTSPTQIFQSQPGGPGDLNAIPNINPNPAIPYRQPNLMGSVAPMPGFPTPPPYQAPPDIAALIAQTQAGSGPMGFA